MTDEERDGVPAEKLVKKMFLQEGWRCMPAKHQRISTDSAEIIHGDDSNVRNPDIFAIRNGEALFVEVKQFRSAVRTKARGQYEHGIREPKFIDYKTVNDDSGIPLWMFIFEAERGKLLSNHIVKLPELEPISPEKCERVYGDQMVFFPRTELEKVAIDPAHVPDEFEFEVDHGVGEELNSVLEGVDVELSGRQTGLERWSTGAPTAEYENTGGDD